MRENEGKAQNNLVALKFNRPRHCGVYRINFMSHTIVLVIVVVATCGVVAALLLKRWDLCEAVAIFLHLAN